MASFTTFLTGIILLQISGIKVLSTASTVGPTLSDPTLGQDPTLGPDPTLDPDPSSTAASQSLSDCNVALTAELGVINTFTTPNYPSNYNANMNCYANISTLSGDEAIELTQTDFEMENSGYCTSDYVAVYDGRSSSSTLLGQYCGTTFPAKITSSSTDLFVRMVSDESFNYKGGTFNYIAVDNSYPACKANFPGYIATAAIQTFGTTGTTYASNADEYFLIDASGAGDLILQLTAMDVENAQNCVYDRITIYDGGCTQYATLANHCGRYRRRWELTGTEYLVHFHSDSSVERKETIARMSSYRLVGFHRDTSYTGYCRDNEQRNQHGPSLGTAGTGPPTTTTTTVGPPLATEVNLMSEVLTNYSSANVPAKDLSTPVGSTVDLYFVGINSLDEVNQKLTSTMQFVIRWTDDFLSWPTTKKAGITQLLIPQDDIWKPDFALLNGFETISQMGSSFMFVSVASNGSCTWKPFQIVDSVCPVVMTDYPYDTQTCELKFSTWSSSGNDVSMTLGDTGIAKHDRFVENGEWTLVSITQRSDTENGKAVAVFTIKMKRNSSFTMFYIAVPVIMLSFMCAFTFAMPIVAGEKSGFAMTVLLAFIVYIVVTFQKMPENSEDLSYFAIYILVMTCVSAVSVMIVNIEARMMTLKTRNKPIASCTRSFTKAIITLQHKWFCHKSTDRFTDISNATNAKGTLKRQHGVNLLHDDKKRAWPDLVSALDFVCFLVYICVVSIVTLFFMVYLGVQ